VDDISSNGGTTLNAYVIEHDPFDGLPSASMGIVGLSHSLDLDTSPGAVQGGSPALVYQSDTVNPAPVVQGIVAVDTTTTPLPSVTVTATLTWDTSVVTPPPWTVNNLHRGDTFVVAVQAPAGQTTGQHSWSLAVSMNYGSFGTLTKSGTTYVVNLASGALNSPFGAGWSLSNVERLFDIPANPGPAGKLWVYGGGGWRFFQGSGGSYTPPANDNGSLTGTGPYTYTGADGHTETFDSNGYETGWKSADGNELITFTYSGGNVATETAIDSTLTTFNYSGGYLQTIKTVNQTRVYTLGYNTPAGTTINDLASVTNPDGGLRMLGYDGSTHRLTSETFGAVQNQWGFATTGMENSSTWGNPSSPSTMIYAPMAAQGLTATVFGNPRGTATDALSNATQYEMDFRGRPTLELAADGGATIWTRDTAGRVLTATDPIGRTTTYVRDSKGYVTNETLPDSSTRAYAYESTFHNVTQITDERSNLTTYQYDSQGHRTAAIDALGKTTTMNYSAGLLTTVTDPLNHTTTYQYDNYRRLSVVTDALTNKTTYTYDNNGNPRTIQDSLSHTSTLLYDVMSRVTGSIDALGNQATYTYCVCGLPLTSTDAEGTQTSIAYDSFNRGLVYSSIDGASSAVQRDTLAQYDAAGRLTGSRDANGWWTTATLDGVGRDILKTDALGNTTQKVYDLAGQLLYERDEQGNWTRHQYDLRGRETQTTDGVGKTWTKGYDAAGNLTTATDPVAHTTSYQYDALNRATTVIDPLTNRTTTAYDASGNVQSVTDVRGTITTYAYDVLNRRTAESTAVTPVDSGTASGGSTTTLQDTTKSWTSSLVGKTVLITAGVGAGQTAIINTVNSPTQVTFQAALLTALGAGSVYQIVSGGQTESRAYDAVGNVTATQDGVANTTQYLYDNADRHTGTIDALSQRTTQVLDKVGTVKQEIDALGKTTTMVLDALHRSVGRIDPLGHQTTQVLDAVDATVGSIDGLGNASQEVTDAVGRVIASVDALGALTRTLYDGHGNVAQRIDPAGNLWQYTYDKENREIVRTDPLGAKVTTSYDDAGRVTQVLDRDNRTQKFSYDNADRVTAATWLSTAGATVNLLTYSYDNGGNVLTAQDTNGTITNAYDALGRMSSTADVFGLTLTYSYDTAGRRTLVQDSKNGVLTSVYDSGNRLTSRQLAGSGVTQALVDLTYTSRNELSGLTRYSDVLRTTLAGTTSYAYDDASRVTSIISKNAAGTALSTYTYLFDNADRVTQESWWSGASNGTHTYAYDTTSQLTLDGTTSYSYDPNGNRTQVGTYTYGQPNDNRVTNDGVYTYGYDAEGNRVTKSKGSGPTLDLTTYTYDNLNHLLTVWETLGGADQVRVTYTYDVLGRRVQEDKAKMGGSVVTTHFAWDGDQVWADLTSGNAVQARYVYGDVTDEVLARVDATLGLLFYLTDIRLSVRDLISPVGVPLDHIEYGAFGAVTTESSAVTGGHIKFTGRDVDPDTGLQYNRARWLDLTTGQWTSEDPILFRAGDSNLQRYVGNNPTNATDPSGLWTWCEFVNSWDSVLGDRHTGWFAWFSNFSAGWADELSFGLTNRFRSWLGYNDVVDHNSNAYGAGEWAGIIHSLLMLKAHLGRNAVAQMGRQGSFLTRLGRGFRRLIWDNRGFRSAVRPMWSGNPPRLLRTGRHLHHALIPHNRWGRWIPRGFRNAGFNYVPISARLNRYMNGSTWTRTAAEWAFRGGLLTEYSAIPHVYHWGQHCNCVCITWFLVPRHPK
jgi:RHS repeat-associated protein